MFALTLLFCQWTIGITTTTFGCKEATVLAHYQFVSACEATRAGTPLASGFNNGVYVLVCRPEK